MVARMLGSVPVLADSVVEQLCRNSDRVSDAHQPLGAASEQEADFLAANVWRSIWPAERYILVQLATLPRWYVPCKTEMAAKAKSLELIVQQVNIACLCGYLRKYCSLRRLRQREFFTFGMDVLLKLDLQETRQFFTAFFSLSDFYWQVAHHSCLI